MTILGEEKNCCVSEAALLSEASLAEDWNRPEEDTAWSHLQPTQIGETQISKAKQEVLDDELCSEYRFDYSKGRPNRFNES